MTHAEGIFMMEEITFMLSKKKNKKKPAQLSERWPVWPEVMSRALETSSFHQAVLSHWAADVTLVFLDHVWCVCLIHSVRFCFLFCR